MGLFQKIHDALHGGPDGPPELRALSPLGPPPVPLRTRMGTPADVAMILDTRAERLGFGAGWRASLPDLFALLGHENTAERRDDLAIELNIDTSGLSAADADAALHAALIQRVAENGALAPQDFFK